MGLTQHFVFGFRTVGSISEGKFDTELNLTRRLGIEKSSEIITGVQVGIEPDKARMVEQVEEFRTELESVTFLEPPILRHREVDVRDRFSSH